MRWFKFGLLAALALALGACSGTPSTADLAELTATPGVRTTDGLVALFQRELDSGALSDFAIEVFTRAAAAGRIDPADYEEAHLRFDRCLRAAGFEAIYSQSSDGLYVMAEWVMPELTDEFRAVSGACYRSFLYRIETMFVYQLSHPDLLLDSPVKTARCLRETGLAPDSYSADDFKRDAAAEPGQSPFANAPFDVRDPEVRQCLRGAGYVFSP
ncbi:MAG: hypothetical protein LBK54_01070 [Propionibacteriaceae bacterium]|jgi:hypothetical protein|nr:hypothetical protein [Propionibacteriaceae bacterium]